MLYEIFIELRLLGLACESRHSDNLKEINYLFRLPRSYLSKDKLYAGETQTGIFHNI